MATKKIDAYSFPTPNGKKIHIMLEELGVPYEYHSVNISKDEQFKPEFLAINPNNKIPAIVDNAVEGEPIKVFESGAILIYLAEKYDKFLPKDTRQKFETIEWVMWQMSGVGPMIGQANHFVKAAQKIEYAINRYTNEAKRLLGVLDKHLLNKQYVAAGAFTIADIIIFPWVQASLLSGLGLNIDDYPNVKKWSEFIGTRDGVKRGMAVGAPPS